MGHTAAVEKVGEVAILASNGPRGDWSKFSNLVDKKVKIVKKNG